MPRLGSRSPRAEDAKVYGYCTFWPTHHPALTPSPYTVAESKRRARHRGGSRKLNPTRNPRNPRIAVRQSKPSSRATKPQTITHVLDSREGAAGSAHNFKQKAAHDTDHTEAGTRQSTKTGQNHTTPKDHTERDAERHADAETETEAPEKSHEVHLGEGANTGAQLPAREDRKLSVCLRVPASRRRIGCWRRERGGSQISLTRCISAKVQTRVHNFQPERRRPKT